MYNMIRKSTIFIFIMVGFSLPLISAQTADEIARKSMNLSSPRTMTAETQLLLISATGTKEKQIIQSFFQKKESKTNMLIIFKSPTDIAGTKFLNSTAKGKTTQRLYLPAIKRIRFIAASSKGNSFMGTDFSYYDLEDKEFKDFNYELLEKGATINDKAFKNMTFFRIKTTPKHKTPYAYTIQWIAEDNFFSYRSDCYNKRNKKVKEIVTLKTQKTKRYIIPTIILAVTLAENHKTFWIMKNYTTDAKLDQELFNPGNLR